MLSIHFGLRFLNSVFGSELGNLKGVFRGFSEAMGTLGHHLIGLDRIFHDIGQISQNGFLVRNWVKTAWKPQSTLSHRWNRAVRVTTRSLTCCRPMSMATNSLFGLEWGSLKAGVNKTC